MTRCASKANIVSLDRDESDGKKIRYVSSSGASSMCFTSAIVSTAGLIRKGGITPSLCFSDFGRRGSVDFGFVEDRCSLSTSADGGGFRDTPAISLLSG